MSTNYNTIVLKGADNRRVSEYQAGVAVNPGYLCKLYAATTLKVKPCDVAGTVKGAKLFAIEQEYIAKGTGTQYAIGDTVMLHPALPGDVIYAKLAASATAITLGDFLEPANDGTLKKVTADTFPVITDSTGGTPTTPGTFAVITAPSTGDASNNADSTSTNAAIASIANTLAKIAIPLNTLSTLGDVAAMAQAIDTVDNSGGSGEVFIRVMIL